MKIEFKNLLEEQFKTAKEYKPNWFARRCMVRFKPERGKDKRGVTGVQVEKIREIGKKITLIPESFNAHPTLKKIFENKKNVPNGKILIGQRQNTLLLRHC